MLHGRDLLEYRMAVDHHARLRTEGDANRLARIARPAGSRTRGPRTVLARLGAGLVALGRRLQALDAVAS